MGIKENFQQAVRELTGGGKDDNKKTKPSVNPIKNAVAADDTSEFPAIGKSDASTYSEIEKKAAAAASEYSRQQTAFNAGNYQTPDTIPDTLINSNDDIQSQSAPKDDQISFGSMPDDTSDTDMTALMSELTNDTDTPLSPQDDIFAQGPYQPDVSAQTGVQQTAQPSGMGSLIADRLHDDDEQTDVLSRLNAPSQDLTASQVSQSSAPQSQSPASPLFGDYPGKQQRDTAPSLSGFFGKQQSQPQQGGVFFRDDRRSGQTGQTAARGQQPAYGRSDGYDAGYSAGYSAGMSAAAARSAQPPRQEPTDRRGAGYDRGTGNGSGGAVPPVPPFFGSQDGSRQPYPEDDETTVISRNTVIDGNIRSFANMSVEGNIKGNVETTKDIDLNGKIVGNIACNNANMRTSQIQGNIQMKGSAFMGRDTLLIGDLKSGYANVNGKIKGNLDVTGVVDLRSDAVIFGDIQASTLSVLNGAIIQGYVSTTFLNKEESKNIFPDTITIGD